MIVGLIYISLCIFIYILLETKEDLSDYPEENNGTLFNHLINIVFIVFTFWFIMPITLFFTLLSLLYKRIMRGLK